MVRLDPLDLRQELLDKAPIIFLVEVPLDQLRSRRDPFRSLIGPAPKLEPGQRPPGVAGFLIDEMKLQGILKTRHGLTAMINGPDNKGHLLRVGDKVLDGEVIRITATGIVFRQEVNDPTRIERFREVVKDLAPQSGKQ